VRVTVLGASAVSPNPGGACAGYLVRTQRARLLLDCGPGVVARLGNHADLADVDAIVISHAHLDHYLDLLVALQSLRHGPLRRPEPPLPVYVPSGLDELLARTALTIDSSTEEWPGMALVAYRPEDVLDVGGARVTFRRVRHSVPTCGIRVEADGRTLAFTADSGPCSEVVELAQGADLLISEATLPEREGNEAMWFHMSASEAGALAAQAGARALVLSHYWSGYGLARMAEAAAATYGGPVIVAREDGSHDV
jgi:ribonuclease BN (tRNA processing enzyme)